MTFSSARVAVFCDGDFWHGRDWESRRDKLATGSNSGYWLAKISRNIQRDQVVTDELRAQGWTVIRLWETDILKNAEAAAATVLQAVTLKRQAVADGA